MKKLLIIPMLILITLQFNCAFDYKVNRVYLPPWKYDIAIEYYEESYSLDIVKRHLVDQMWYKSEINEAIYRLEHEYAVTEIDKYPELK